MTLMNFYSGNPANRESGINGLEFGFADRLYAMILSLPNEIAGQVTVYSAYRSVEHQQQLWDKAVIKYGSEEAARKWVAPPGRSNHNGGMAVDLAYGSEKAKRWVHENAGKFGLALPMKHEPWHIEPAGLRQGSYVASGKTWGGNEHKSQGAFAESYTDGGGLGTEDDHDPLVQMRRLVDMMRGSMAPTAEFVKRGAQAMADRNSGYMEKRNG